jgi:hypothetical protein
MRLIDLPDFPPADSPVNRLIEFGLDRHEIDRFWRVLLAMCVRDRATALWWHPWRQGGALAYMVHGKRLWLYRPPVELDALMLAAARDLLSPSRLRAAAARWLGWPVTGHFQTRGGPGASEWCGAVWSGNGVWCADFHRLDVIIQPIVETRYEGAVPAAVPDPAT